MKKQEKHTAQMTDLTMAEQLESEMFRDLNWLSIAESSVALQQLVPL
jgi:hypothetical protein